MPLTAKPEHLEMAQRVHDLDVAGKSTKEIGMLLEISIRRVHALQALHRQQAGVMRFPRKPNIFGGVTCLK